MKRTVRLNERDLTRIVRRVIKESGEMSNLPSAMKAVDSFLRERGGMLGARTPEEIMDDLKALQHAIRLEMNNMEVASKHRNPNWGSDELRYPKGKPMGDEMDEDY